MRESSERLYVWSETAIRQFSFLPRSGSQRSRPAIDPVPDPFARPGRSGHDPSAHHDVGICVSATGSSGYPWRLIGGFRARPRTPREGAHPVAAKPRRHGHHGNLRLPGAARAASKSAKSSVTKSTNARTRADGREPRRYMSGGIGHLYDADPAN